MLVTSCRALVAAALIVAHTARAQNPSADFEAPSVEVVGTTPLPGLGTPVREVPANVQAKTGADIETQHTSNISEFLYGNLGSVTVTDGAVNPFQPDISFRGMTASPLLGTPQGLSVFLDGVRINEPFGDVVNWDLVPQNAISTINLVPGSNPVFGLNTLGGALSINTKSGFQYPGGSVSLEGGSWGRKTGEFEYGGHGEKNDVFVSGTWFDEDGWRDHSPSRVRQIFGKVGHQDADTDVDVSLLVADNSLQGTQGLPVSMLNNRAQAYTWPDITDNQLFFLNGRASHFIDEKTLIAGNAYLRRLDSNGFNSNVNDNFQLNEDCQGNAAAATPQACNVRSNSDTTGFGGTLQLSLLDDLFSRKNSFTAGLSADLGRTTFTQTIENAMFTADRFSAGDGILTAFTDAYTTNDYYGIYATDTHSLSDKWVLTLSGRYNWARVRIEDRSGMQSALNGDHIYQRFNPAIGLNFNPTERLTTYASYNEGTRVPTPVELTCADPNAPCRLPNAFLADPALKQVVAKTVELGARGSTSGAFGWSTALYNTNLDDDIQFISAGSGSSNAGFFQNVGNTRRRGVELGGHAQIGALRLLANYSYVEATFRSSFTVHSPNNSTAGANGNIQVSPGDRIPGIPAQAVKLRAEYSFNRSVLVGASVNYFSDQYARGDENNQDRNGKVPGYTLINLDASYQATRALQLFGRVQNLFDRNYETFGLLGENDFVTGSFNPAAGRSEPFFSPGAPRAFWIGLRYEFDKPKGAGKSD